ncbi:MAG TPA: hypothetical protein VJ436_14115 [Anaerolineales bacterium]|nr:hypothetical protein [Anaerolineales bacterium]
MTRFLSRPANGRFRIRIGLAFTLIGFFIFLLGAEPGLFGMDRSPVIGFVQITVFLVGMAIICLGGIVLMNGLWNGIPKTIAADIGLRLVSTGYVIAVVSGMADVFGFGSQISPQIPYFGPWQMRGVILGEIVIALGFVLLIPYSLRQKEPHDHPPTISHQGSRDGKTEINITID